MPKRDRQIRLTAHEALAKLTVDELRPMASLFGAKATTKGELVEFLAELATDAQRVRALYDEIDDLGREALQEATHDAGGELNPERFRAKYGRVPYMGAKNWGSEESRKLRLFFPDSRFLPMDVQKLLVEFVPRPPRLSVSTSDALPGMIKPPHVSIGDFYKPSEQEVELRVLDTARPALANVKAVLQLIDAGKLKVGQSTGRPSEASLLAVAQVLTAGDFYSAEDKSEAWTENEVNIQSLAWPMLLQAGGLAEATASRLQLTAAGRKALTAPAHQVIQQLWKKWLASKLLDEFSRVDIIKGQQSKGRNMTAAPPRRQAIVEVLQECPVGKWISIEELFRLLKASGVKLAVAQNEWNLYLCEQEYGSFGFNARYTWESLQGRFVLAFLFEYAATLGVLDVAYIPPFRARSDFRDRWGADDLEYLSRYDGLLFVRINALGAFCLQIADQYLAEAIAAAPVLKVLANRDVVASERELAAADRLFLERFAERQSDAVWHLESSRILQAVEKGMKVADLQEFLAAKSSEPVPQTVNVFLQDLADKTSQLEDLGVARMFACADANLAQQLIHDRRLRSLCVLSGERNLVFKLEDEAAVRKALRELGYVLPLRE